jgi:UMF1 family MFS transporter
MIGTAEWRGRWSWALYDWANSPFATIVITFIFPAYFERAVVGDPVSAQSLWGYAIAASGILLAVLAPVLGSVADTGGGRKPWIFAFTLICVLGSALLWFAGPSPEWIALCLACVIFSNVAFELGIVFNNAMLPDLVPEERLGRLSGWAWGLGYAGGLAALVLVLVLFIWPETPPFGLDKEAAEHVRIAGPLVALWLALFSMPLFLFTPDRRAGQMPAGRAVREGLRSLRRTISALRTNRPVAVFLLAHVFYADGFITLFAFGGIYASGAFGFTLEEVVTFGVVLNVAAGLGALAFAWADDWLGSKPIILLALVGLIVASTFAALATTRTGLWIAGMAIGIFVGPAQAASRSLMARLTEPDTRAAFFGLYALSGKATAFLGPALVATVTATTGSQRAGIATIIAFFVVGMALLLWVPEPKRAHAPEKALARPSLPGHDGPS